MTGFIPEPHHSRVRANRCKAIESFVANVTHSGMISTDRKPASTS